MKIIIPILAVLILLLIIGCTSVKTDSNTPITIVGITEEDINKQITHAVIIQVAQMNWDQDVDIDGIQVLYQLISDENLALITSGKVTIVFRGKELGDSEITEIMRWDNITFDDSDMKAFALPSFGTVSAYEFKGEMDINQSVKYTYQEFELTASVPVKGVEKKFSVLYKLNEFGIPSI